MDLSRKHSIELEEVSKKAKSLVKFLKKLQAFSQEEGLAVLMKTINYFCKLSIKISHKDFTIIIDAVLNQQNRIILDECESNLELKLLKIIKL